MPSLSVMVHRGTPLAVSMNWAVPLAAEADGGVAMERVKVIGDPPVSGAVCDAVSCRTEAAFATVKLAVVAETVKLLSPA